MDLGSFNIFLKSPESQPSSGPLIPGDYQYSALKRGHPVQRAWHKAKLDLISEVAPPSVNELVLDAGCGSGVVADFLATSGARVVAVDLNEDAVSFGRRRFQRSGLEFVCSSLLDFKGGPFHQIYCLECIEHFPRSKVIQLLVQLGRLTVPGGRLLLTTPNYRSTWPLIERFLDFAKLTPKLRGEQHLSPMTPLTFKQCLESGGWKLLEMGSFNGIAPFVAFLSITLAGFAGKWELRHRRSRHRNLLYALCEADPNRG
jgi:SAM-dependent methyltransferase